MRLSRRDFLAAAGGAAAAQGAQRPPNIVLIAADDLGYGDLGCYGQDSGLKTPRIDALAGQGTRFTQAYAGSTVCAPSRCCLMTGKHTGHCRVRGNARPEVSVLPREETLAETLRRAGYRTGMFGKWGLGGPGQPGGLPNGQGFDEFFGYLDQLHAHDFYPRHLWRNRREIFLDGNRGGRREAYSHDLIAEEALGFLRRNRENPFFLYLPFTIPHANNERGRTTGDGMEVPDYGSFADRDWPRPEKGFAAMIERLDRDVGRVLDLLAELGLEENTLVVFTSDNGPHREGGHDPEFFGSRGPLRGIKRDLYEGGIRVPAIARWPGRIPAGAESDQVWAFWDLQPTLAEAAGVEPPPGIDGLSMLSPFQGRPQSGHESLYWEFHERGFDQAVRFGDWKAVRRGGRSAPVELFDLASDVGETHNLAGEHPAQVSRARKLMERAHTPSELFPVRSSG